MATSAAPAAPKPASVVGKIVRLLMIGQVFQAWLFLLRLATIVLERWNDAPGPGAAADSDGAGSGAGFEVHAGLVCCVVISGLLLAVSGLCVG